MILALNSSKANRSVSLFLQTTELTNKPHHKRRIKVFMHEVEYGGTEYQWESAINNMVEEAVGTSVCCLERSLFGCLESQEVANL